MAENVVIFSDKPSPECSSTDEALPSSPDSETTSPAIQVDGLIETEDDYPHGIRLVFVVTALILSMFLVCILPLGRVVLCAY